MFWQTSGTKLEFVRPSRSDLVQLEFYAAKEDLFENINEIHEKYIKIADTYNPKKNQMFG